MDEKQRQAAGAVNELQSHFDQHRIWFEPDTCTRTDAVITQLRNTYNLFALHRHAAGQNRGDEARAWGQAWDRVENDVPPLRTALEADFRSLLGVEAMAPAP